MSERDNILGRIREALKVPAPPADHQSHSRPSAALPTNFSSPIRKWLPAVGPSAEDQLALFRQKATGLKADFHLLSGREELANKVAELRKAEGWTKVGAHSGVLTDFACQRLDLPICRTERGYQVEELENCNAGITECDALVAQTGSVLVTALSASGRALSVLPPHHVVLARRDQLVGDLPEAFALLKQKYGAKHPSFISFITGPSRTGDIERILVLGAHGPQKLTILCLE